MLWRCEICGEAFIGDEASNCAFCGARKGFMKAFHEAIVSFDVSLEPSDMKNVETALELELSNTAFYNAASALCKEVEAQKIFHALAIVEAEHARIWKKVLKMVELPIVKEKASASYRENLMESHIREEKAIKFYREALKASKDARVRQILGALVLVETDHLKLSEERL
jgi:rubrerythrin